MRLVTSAAMVGVGGALALLLGGQVGWADQFHYNNLLMGNRAMGLGGAYTAVSDDASGLVYNPAGLAFALSSDISGSGNAWTFRTIEYLDIEVLDNAKFVEESEGKFAPFLGGIQKLDNVMRGLVAGFGFWTSDGELKNQNDLIKTDRIPRFHRTVNLRASTDTIGAAAAMRIAPTISIGFGVNYVTTDELLQEYQDVVSAKSTELGYLQILTQNVRQQLTAAAVEPVLGMQFVLGKLSLGITAKFPFIVTENFEKGVEQHTAVIKQDLTVVTAAEDPEGKYGGGKVARLAAESKIEKPLGQWPAEYRFGTALFATTTFLWTFDVIHRGAAKGDVASFERDAVTNYATGVEWYVTNSIPLRAGVFTNYDARPDLKDGLTDQRDHIDYTGFSLFGAMITPNSSTSAGIVYQQGTGKAQKVGGALEIQEVSASSMVVSFGATQNF